MAGRTTRCAHAVGSGQNVVELTKGVVVGIAFQLRLSKEGGKEHNGQRRCGSEAGVDGGHQFVSVQAQCAVEVAQFTTGR